jgi:hypothetical protein
MKKYLFYLFIFISCNKEPVIEYQKITPLPYLPVFPGSYWNYVDSYGDTIHMSTSGEYVLDSYKSFSLHGNYTNKVFVPFWNNNPVYGYSTHEFDVLVGSNDITTGGEMQVAFLTLIPKQRWSIYYSHYGYFAYRIVVAVDTQLTFNAVTYNNVIVTADSGVFLSQPPNYILKRDYYAKNIGLIRSESYSNGNLSGYLDLINYHINY